MHSVSGGATAALYATNCAQGNESVKKLIEVPEWMTQVVPAAMGGNWFAIIRPYQWGLSKTDWQVMGIKVQTEVGPDDKWLIDWREPKLFSGINAASILWALAGTVADQRLTRDSLRNKSRLAKTVATSIALAARSGRRNVITSATWSGKVGYQHGFAMRYTHEGNIAIGW